MWAGTWRLVVWGALAGASVAGCRENVYIGDPIDVADQVVPDAAPITDAQRDADANLPEAMPVDRPRPIVAWYLHTVGSKIFDSKDAEFPLKGINWAGMETSLRAPDGLHALTLDAMMAQIAKLGFNLIRIPYSNESVAPTSTPTYNLAALNPELMGLSSLEVLDRIIDVAADYGLRVVLDRYRFRSDSGGQPRKWYSGTDPASLQGGYPESTWIADWERLATRYLSKPNMVGCDLHDEAGGTLTWGGDDPVLDWRAAAERAGSRILAINSNLVVIVGGIEGMNPTSYWPGGNLRAASTFPVRLTPQRQLIYSIHDYGMSLGPDKPWFADPNFDFEQFWSDTWGYLVTSNTTPVIVGAFTDRKDEPGIPAEWSAADAAWRVRLLAYIAANQLGYIFWAINPSAEGRSGLLVPGWDMGPNQEWSTLLQLSPP